MARYGYDVSNLSGNNVSLVPSDGCSAVQNRVGMLMILVLKSTGLNRLLDVTLGLNP